jgi:hypothetical protein
MNSISSKIGTRLQVLCRKENSVLPPRQSKFRINKYWIIIVQLLLSRNWTVIVRPLLIILTISKVIVLSFQRDWSLWKAKTWGYKFSVERRTQFYPQDSQNFSSTNQSCCLTESVMTQSQLMTHNWSSTAPNWARPIFLVN